MIPKLDKKDCVRLAWIQITSTDWPFVPEFQFHPVRKWRFDWAFLEKKIAIEIEGVTYGGAGGRHQRGLGLEKDAEKYNCAAENSWTVLRYTPRMIQQDPHGVITQIVNIAASRETQ